MDDWRACSVTQLGLYVGLFQLFVADKISHKGCFTLQARCPEMVFLEERSNWESRPGPWAIRAATGYIGQWCVQVARGKSVLQCLRPLHTQSIICPSPGSRELQPQQTAWGGRWLYRCTWSSLDTPFWSPHRQAQQGDLWVPATGRGFCW